MVRGVWDLRGRTSAYLGDPDREISWQSCRVLEVGPASGHVSLWLEAQDATVSCIELGENGEWDFVPYQGQSPSWHYLEDRRAMMRGLRQGLRWALERAGSTVDLHNGTVYDIPSLLEDRFDTGVMAMVLLHVARPFDALAALASRCRRVVVTELFPWSFLQPAEVEAFFAGAERAAKTEAVSIPADIIARIADQQRALVFAPQGRRGEPKETWWHITPSWTVAALEVLGFRRFCCNYHLQRHDGRRAWAIPPDAHEAMRACYSITAERE